jgi:ABC-2 type transport system ATP-binding protein
MESPLIQVRDVSKVYVPSPLWLRALIRTSVREPVHALKNVSLEVMPGKICAVVGPNGAGKSTLFRVLTGLTTPTTGSATVAGFDAEHQSTAVRRMVGFMPADDRSLWLRNTCIENLQFHGRLQGMRDDLIKKRMRETLELVGLSHAANRVGFALSSGMRARLQIARALLHRPKVLILDEPTGSVDPVGAFELVRLIKDITVRHGLAVVISSHRLDEVEELHDAVLLLDKGRVIYHGSLDHMRQRWEKPQIVVDFADEAYAVAGAKVIDERLGTGVSDVSGSQVSVSTEVAAGEVIGILNGQVANIVSVAASRMPLHQLMSKILADSEQS